MSPISQFWISLILITVQILLIIEWSFFNDLRELHFSQFESQFSWRCLNGAEVIDFSHQFYTIFRVNSCWYDLAHISASSV
jgi:hypothetical protein